MNWRWNAKRLLISAFLVVHLAALAVYNLPACHIRERFYFYASTYMVPLGLWQSWAMFAPNPTMHEMTLEAVSLDARGIQRTFVFAKMNDFSYLQAAPRVRHSKYASNVGEEVNTAIRECAARHVVRQMNIPPESFPVEVELYYQVRETPPLGEASADPMKPPYPRTLKTYRFNTAEEVHS